MHMPEMHGWKTGNKKRIPGSVFRTSVAGFMIAGEVDPGPWQVIKRRQIKTMECYFRNRRESQGNEGEQMFDERITIFTGHFGSGKTEVEPSIMPARPPGQGKRQP